MHDPNSRYSIDKMIARNEWRELIAWWNKFGHGYIGWDTWDWCTKCYFDCLEKNSSQSSVAYWSYRALVMNTIISHALYSPIDHHFPSVEQQLREVV